MNVLPSNLPLARGRLWVLFLSAVALRVAVIFLLRTTHAAPITFEHGEIARHLLAGRGFSVWFLGSEGPTSQQAPLYPLLLAGCYWIWGIDSPAAILAMQLLQAVIGGLLVVLIAKLGHAQFPAQPAIGWWAGLLAACFPTHLYMATHLQVVSWAAALLALLLYWLHRPGWRDPFRPAIAIGLTGGVLVLFDPILVLALPILAVAWMIRWWQADREAQGRRRALARAFCSTGLMTLAALLILAPWLIRNRLVHGEWVFVKSTFGYAFWQGNNAHSFGTDKVPQPSAEEARLAVEQSSAWWQRLAQRDRALWAARHETVYIDDLLLKPGGYREFQGLSEPARSRLLWERSRAWIADNPGKYAALCGQRLRYFLLFDDTNPKSREPIYRLATITWLAAALAGLVVCRRRFNVIWPTLALCGTLTLFHTLTITSARFRIPLEPLTLVWAGAACAQLAALLQRGARLLRQQVGARQPTTAGHLTFPAQQPS